MNLNQQLQQQGGSDGATESLVQLLFLLSLMLSYGCQLLITNTVIVLRLLCTCALFDAGHRSKFFPVLIT